jgi:DedD protein
VERRLKQRLVGAVVLVSLVVIFVPMLLEDEPVLRRGIDGTNIPALPPGMDEFPSRTLPPPYEEPAPSTRRPETGAFRLPPLPEPAPQDEAAAGTPDPAPAPQPASPSPQAAPKPASRQGPPQAEPADADTRPPGGISAWVVQVASFTRRDNAQALVERLRGQALEAFVEQAEIAGRTWYRVRVGPELDRTEADAMRARIRELLQDAGRNAEVVRYP